MKITAVFKTHFDIGYTKLASEVIKDYSGKMLDEVIATCESTQKLGAGRKYIWTMSSWPLQKILDTASPERLEKTEKLIRGGQLVPHGLPFTTHTELLTQDELAYGCLIAKRICSKYGIKNPVSAKMTDVPGHTSGIISVLADAGIKFLHLGCNPASMPPKVPLLFWWQDKDGNRVLTMYNSEYGSELLPPEGWKFPVWLAMLQTYDNVGPQGPEIIENIEKAVGNSAELTVGTMDDFYNEIIKCDLSGLPVITGELGDTWIHGAGSYPAEIGSIRRARAKLRKIKSFTDSADGQTLKALESFYDNILLFGEHTCGLDVRTYIGDNRRYDKAGFLEQRKEPRFKHIEKSWEEKREIARNAGIAADAVLKAAGYQETDIQPVSDSPFKAEFKDGKIVITMPDGKKVVPSYEYRLISFWEMSEYERHYLQRMCHWGLSDFGRDGHPETPAKIYSQTLTSFDNQNGVLRAEYACEKESYIEYGNAEAFTITVTCLSDRVRVKLELKNKQASPRLEAGNMYFDLSVKGESYIVTKTGFEIDPSRDIVPNANSVLYAAESYAAIDNIAVNTIDAPLVSFGGNGIFAKSLPPFNKPERKCIAVNLFNNQWGTNFPLYTSGDMTFEFEIMELNTARENLSLAKYSDLPKALKK